MGKFLDEPISPPAETYTPKGKFLDETPTTVTTEPKGKFLNNEPTYKGKFLDTTPTYKGKFLDETLPTEKTNWIKEGLTNTIKDITRPFVVQYEKSAEAFNSGVSGFTQRLSDITKYASEKLEIPQSNLLDKIAKSYSDDADYWHKKADKNGVGVIDEIVGSAVGGAIPGITEFMLNVPYAAISGAAEAHKEGKGEITGAIHEGLKRSILGMAFKAGNTLKQPLSALANSGIFAVQTAAEGGSKKDIAKSAAIGALYSVGGGGKLGVKDIIEMNKKPSLEAKPADVIPKDLNIATIDGKPVEIKAGDGLDVKAIPEAGKTEKAPVIEDLLSRKAKETPITEPIKPRSLEQQKMENDILRSQGLQENFIDFEEAKQAEVSYASSEQYAKEQVAKREEARKAETPGIVGKLKNLYKDAKAKLVDFSAPIEDVLREAQQKGKYSILPKEHITNQIDRVLRSPTIAGQFARDNGLVDVIKKVDNLDNLDQYLIAKQAQAVEAQGIKTGRDSAKDAQLIKDFGPKYESYAKVVNEYSRKLLDYSVESGLISKELAEALKVKYPDYVPINRVFNELEKTAGTGSKAIASLSKQTVVQKLQGSEREIENPIASLLQKTNDAFKQGEKNKAGRILASYKGLEGNPFQLRELKEGEKAPNTVSFLDNGTKRTFETTKEIAAAAKAMKVQSLNLLGRIFAFPVRLARIGITGINLPFVAANIAKDQVTAVINSKNSLKTSVANPAVFVKSLFEAVGHGKVYEEMAREGTLGTSFDISRDQPGLSIERIRAGRTPLTKIAYTIRHPGELLRSVENIINRGEEFTRIQQYQGTKEALMKKGMSEPAARIEAARASRENTVNFARRGEWGTVLNSTFLYLNANIQGTRTFVRNFKERPGQTAAKIALVVFAPVALSTAWNLSDEKRKKAYMDIDEATKQNNIIIIPPNPIYHKDTNTWDIIKIPLSQEINNIANMPRRAVEQAYKLNPVTAGDIVTAFAGTISPINPTKESLMSTLTPQAIKPTLEAYTNKSFFTGRPQVPQSMEKISPELQAKSYTSGTARELGKILKASPIKIEEWIRGTTGGIGSQALHASDIVLNKLDIIPKDQIRGQGVIKAIMARFAEARGGHLEDVENKRIEGIIRQQADDNFRLKQEAEILYTELKKLPGGQANTKAEELRQNRPLLFEKLKDVAQADQKGLDYNDRLMLQLQVNSGQRAKFINSNLKAFKTNNEKNNYIQTLQKKGIISDKILEQLRYLIANENKR